MGGSMNIDVNVLDEKVCRGCPRMDLRCARLFAAGDVVETDWSCSNRGLCEYLARQIAEKVGDAGA